MTSATVAKLAEMILDLSAMITRVATEGDLGEARELDKALTQLRAAYWRAHRPA